MAERAFVFGATGYLGRQVVSVLLADGFDVAALSHRVGSRDEIAALGARPVVGSLDDLSTYASELQQAEAIVVVGRMPYEREAPLVADLDRVLGDESTGAERALIYTSGTGVLGIHAPEGQWDQSSFAEDDEFTPPPWLELRVRTERRVRDLAGRGIRAMVIRPPLKRRDSWTSSGKRALSRRWTMTRQNSHTR
jgi:nucleoside-diphosphate-sugar epimerase